MHETWALCSSIMRKLVKNRFFWIILIILTYVSNMSYTYSIQNLNAHNTV